MKNLPLENARTQQRVTAQPLHLLPLRFPPKLVLLPLNALIFKESLAEGAPSLEKASSVADAGAYTHATFTGWSGSFIKVIL